MCRDVPARFVLYFLSWSGFLVSFMMRNDINFAIVVMVKSATKNNITNSNYNIKFNSPTYNNNSTDYSNATDYSDLLTDDNNNSSNYSNSTDLFNNIIPEAYKDSKVCLFRDKFSNLTFLTISCTGVN
jgi:hypothetical protein